MDGAGVGTSAADVAYDTTVVEVDSSSAVEEEDAPTPPIKIFPSDTLLLLSTLTELESFPLGGGVIAGAASTLVLFVTTLLLEYSLAGTAVLVAPATLPCIVYETIFPVS